MLSYLGGFEGVVGREGDVQEEDAPLVHGARWSQDGRPPLIDVVSFWASTAGTNDTSISIFVFPKTQIGLICNNVIQI